MAEEFPSEEFEDPPAFFPKDLNRGGQDSTAVEVRVEGVGSTEENGTIHRYVQLVDDRERSLPIAIGPFEAMAIGIALEGTTISRPLTHDLLKVIIERLNGELTRVVIDDLWNSTYYAKLYVTVGKEEVEIDCRPSDAIALAVRANAEIYVLESILEAYHGEDAP